MLAKDTWAFEGDGFPPRMGWWERIGRQGGFEPGHEEWVRCE